MEKEKEIRSVYFRVEREIYDGWMKKKEERGDYRTIQDWMRGIIDAWFTQAIPSRPDLPERIGEVDRQLLETFVQFCVEPKTDPQRTVIIMLRQLAKNS